MSLCKVVLFSCYLTCGFSLRNILIYREGEIVARIQGKI